MGNILISGGLIPTTPNTLVDAREKVSTFAKIAEIENPALYMVITVEDTGKKYEVKKLTSKVIGGIVVQNAAIDINDPEALLDLGLAEELRAEDEKVRQENETKRIEAESLRKTAEDSRSSNERSRITAESSREASEKTRANAEEVRNANEQTRNLNESKRQSQESTRQNQESARQDNESTRNANESARKTAETERNTEETSRRASEIARKEAENTRSKNEQSRTVAENTRSSAEDRRVASEETRNANEKARINAELSREQAEGNRASTFNTLKGELQTTIKEGQDANVLSEAATNRANEAAEVIETWSSIVATIDDIDEDVNNPESDIVNEALRKTPQTLSKAEQSQARKNIGAASLDESNEFKAQVEEQVGLIDGKVTDLGSEVGYGKLVIGVNRDKRHTGILPSSYYRLSFNTKGWGLSSMSDGSFIMGVHIKYRGTDDELSVIAVKKGEWVTNNYEFATEDKDVEYVRIAINGDSGSSVSYLIEDVTYPKKIDKGYKEKFDDVDLRLDDIGIAVNAINGELKIPIGNNVSNKHYTIIPNSTYRITFAKKSWALNLLPTSTVFAAFVKYQNEEQEIQIAYAINNNVDKSYTLAIKDSIVEYVRIAVNGDVGDVVRYELVNITALQSVEYKTERNSKDLEKVGDEVFDTKELLPSDSLLSQNTPIITDENGKGIGAGLWEIRYTETDSIEKLDDGSFKVSLNPSGVNSALWLLNLDTILANVGKVAHVKFSYKADNFMFFTIGGGNSLQLTKKDDWYEYDGEFIIGSTYTDGRIMFYNSVNTVFYIKDISISLRESNIDKLNQKIEELSEGSITEVKDINLLLPNFLYKKACIELDEKEQCVIGFIGDSWTQHSWEQEPKNGEEGMYNIHTNYVQPLVRYLKNKYGNAGGGYYSFSQSHIGKGDTKMMSADYEDAWDERSLNSTGLITYRDQSEGCLGIDAADATFHQGSYLTLHITKPHNRLVVHFYGGSDTGVFTYTIDSENSKTVDARIYNGYTTLAIETTDNTHVLRFDCISGSVAILGVDMQRDSSGIRVHKIANKGITSDGFVIVNEESWKTGINKLGLDSVSILLGTNDGPTATETIFNNLKTIMGRIISVNPYIDKAIIAPSSNPTRNMIEQAKWQFKAANELGSAFVNLVPLFGSVEQIVNKGTFSDISHPTLEGGKMIANYLIDKLFK